MVGNWSILISEVRPFTIHGDVYYEVQAVRIDDRSNVGLVLRVPEHACKTPPVPGQNAAVTFLMGQVTGLE
jgi:hypothetical protein